MTTLIHRVVDGRLSRKLVLNKLDQKVNIGNVVCMALRLVYELEPMFRKYSLELIKENQERLEDEEEGDKSDDEESGDEEQEEEEVNKESTHPLTSQLIKKIMKRESKTKLVQKVLRMNVLYSFTVPYVVDHLLHRKYGSMNTLLNDLSTVKSCIPEYPLPQDDLIRLMDKCIEDWFSDVLLQFVEAESKGEGQKTKKLDVHVKNVHSLLQFLTSLIGVAKDNKVKLTDELVVKIDKSIRKIGHHFKIQKDYFVKQARKELYAYLNAVGSKDKVASLKSNKKRVVDGFNVKTTVQEIKDKREKENVKKPSEKKTKRVAPESSESEPSTKRRKTAKGSDSNSDNEAEEEPKKGKKVPKSKETKEPTAQKKSKKNLKNGKL